MAALWDVPLDRFTARTLIIPRTDTHLVGFSFLSRMAATPAAIRSMMLLPDGMDRLIGAAGGKAYLSGFT